MANENLKDDFKAFRRTRREQKESSLIYGKVPPQVSEAMEAAVLGAIMLEPRKLDDVLGLITDAEMFYRDANQKIYASIQALRKLGSAIDLLTVTSQLRKQDELELIGGPYYVTQLTMNVVTSAHVMSHAKEIIRAYQLREIIRHSGNAIAAAYDSDAEPDILSYTTSQALSQFVDRGEQDAESVGDIANVCIETIQNSMSNPGTLSGVSTGFKELNEITHGFSKQDVIIVAARPAQGKTAFALDLALNAGKPVLFFSLEMSKVELVNRLLSNISGVELKKIRTGHLTQEEFEQVLQARIKLGRMKIFIDDRGGLTPASLRARARYYLMKYGIEEVIVDYLQLMSVTDAKGKNREVQVSEISRELKSCAKELDIAVIALSQMSRGIETRKGRPMLSDLRESGAIEQDASIVMFIWHEKDGNDGTAKTRIVVAKNRNGTADVDVELNFYPAVQQWRDKEVHIHGFDTFMPSPYAGMPSSMPSGNTTNYDTPF